jgi:hypothetical protein
MKTILLLLVAFLGYGATYTEICGEISLPTSLVRSKSPYLLTGDLLIHPGARLSLESGVTLFVEASDRCSTQVPQVDYIDSQLISIKVEGSLYIHGNPDHPVRILPKDTNVKSGGWWDGIHLTRKRNQTAQLQYFEIRGAHRALFIQNSSFNIANAVFAYNNNAVYLSTAANVSIFNSLFTQNYLAGIHIDRSFPTIYANIFYDNIRYGIFSDSRQGIKLGYNLFWQNQDAHCFRCPLGTLRRSAVNLNLDSTDASGNLIGDPVFLASTSYKEHKKRDPFTPTETSRIADPKIAELHQKAKQQAPLGLPKQPEFSAIGRGAWVLSRYSKAVNLAPRLDFFQTPYQDRWDAGPNGGFLDRVQERPPF